MRCALQNIVKIFLAAVIITTVAFPTHPMLDADADTIVPEIEVHQPVTTLPTTAAAPAGQLVIVGHHWAAKLRQHCTFSSRS